MNKSSRAKPPRLDDASTPTLAVGSAVVDALRAQLPSVGELTVAAVIDGVPSYADALHGPMGVTIAEAVQLALAGFLHLLGSGSGSDAGTPLRPALDGAYALGRGEARSGRTMEALLGAYRVGARVAWREMSSTAVAADLPAPQLAQFAELVFAYIDQLSAASVAGHSDELATTGRVRQRYLEQLGEHLLRGATAEVIHTAAQRADWEPPETMVVVLLASSQVGVVRSGLDARTLEISEESSGEDDGDGQSVLLVPSTGAVSRGHLIRYLRGRRAIVGPERSLPQVVVSYRRVQRLAALGHRVGTDVVDSEAHLGVLVCTADREALADLRAQVLAPLADLRPGTAERLTETLRSWLLHQGRRDDIAAELVVHPQTIRYRMTQLRELYGERLADPETIANLTIALASDRPLSPPTPRAKQSHSNR